MRRLGLVVAVVMALGAQAAEPAQRPADAPVIVEAGEPVGSRSLCKPEAKAIRDESRCTACEVERAELRKSAGAAWWVPVIVGAIALGAGVSIGAAVANAERGKP